MSLLRGSVVNFLSLFDDFIVWQQTKRSVEAPIHILIHESANTICAHTLMPELAYGQYHVSKTKRIPLLWGQKELTLGGYPIAMYVETELDSAVHIKFVGDMRAFTGRACLSPLLCSA